MAVDIYDEESFKYKITGRDAQVELPLTHGCTTLITLPYAQACFGAFSCTQGFAGLLRWVASVVDGKSNNSPDYYLPLSDETNSCTPLPLSLEVAFDVARSEGLNLSSAIEDYCRKFLKHALITRMGPGVYMATFSDLDTVQARPAPSLPSTTPSPATEQHARKPPRARSERTIAATARKLQKWGIPITRGELRSLLVDEGWLVEGVYSGRTPHIASQWAMSNGYLMRAENPRNIAPYVTDLGLDYLRKRLTRTWTTR
jgi:hypothetical protein